MIYINEKIENLYRVPQPEGRGTYIRLDQNENPDGIPLWLFDIVKSKITPEFLSIYPEETRLTEKFADYLNINHNQVTLTCGSVVGMGYVIKVFGEAGKNLLCVTPSFGMYKVYAEMVGMNAISLPYNDDFSFDVNDIINNINDKTGIVVLVNPNMPVGNVYEQTDIEKVVKKAKENNALVMIDEAYFYFYDKTSIKLLSKYDNIVLLRTFSKMLSIPALRLGAIISTPKIIQCLNNYKPHYTVNSVALLFGEAIIDNIKKLLPELQEKFIKGRDYLIENLEQNNYEILDSHGCFLCVKPKKLSVHELGDKLKENNILVLKGTGLLENYIRVTIADKKYMKIFVDTLVAIDK